MDVNKTIVMNLQRRMLATYFSLLMVAVFFIFSSYISSPKVFLSLYKYRLMPLGTEMAWFHIPLFLFMAPLIIVYNDAFKNRLLIGRWDKKIVYCVVATLIVTLGGEFVLSESEYVVRIFDYPLETNIIRAIIILIFAPIVEEIVFRGFFLDAFILSFGEKLGFITGTLVVSCFFCAIHTQYALDAQIQIGLMSIIFCFARKFSGGLAIPMLLHSFCSIIALSL